jgi:hypothetical protein
VLFVGSGAANLITTLGADCSIKGLTFTSTATSPVTITGNSLTIGVDGLAVQSGSAAHTINSAVTLGGSETWHIANDTGSPLTIAGALTLPASATLTKADGGTLRVTGAPSLGTNSSLAVNGGSLKFAMTSGSPAIGTGITATIAAGATLELAGTVSALASTVAPSRRVNIVNNSSASGLLVSGTNQQVGVITGSGTTTVAAGADLTANSIVQSALVIGGTQGNPALLTIAASDSSGNPLAVAGGDTLAFDNTAASADSSGGVIMPSFASPLTAAGSLDLAGGVAVVSASGLGAVGASDSSGVPEPSTLVYGAIAVICGVIGFRRTVGQPWRRILSNKSSLRRLASAVCRPIEVRRAAKRETCTAGSNPVTRPA